MDREEIIRMAREACSQAPREDWNSTAWVFGSDGLETFAALVAAAERNKLASWMIRFGLATGHGDTMEQLLEELGTEILDSIDFAVGVEREQCARLAEQVVDGKRWFNDLPIAIRARSQDETE